ncbi:MAG TPA: spore coat U domain-containing protein [Thermoanaerobaculia bacterium]
MRLNVRAVLLVCAVMLMPIAADAGNCTCNGSTVNVGAYSVFLTGPMQPTATITVDCNGNATYNIAFGTGNSGSYASRRMDQGSGGSLNYNIYTDATRTTVWATTNVIVYNTGGSSGTFSQQLFLKIDPLQDAPYSGGTYQDSIPVTMTPVAGTGGPTRSCSFSLQATVIPECRAPATTLAFGNYDPVVANATVASPKNATVNLLYNCTKGISSTVGLDLGSHISGTTRRMAGPSANFLTYDIFSDSARTQRWTNVLGGLVAATSSSKDTPLGGISGLSAYGTIPGNQDVVGGSYSDTVTATINY